MRQPILSLLAVYLATHLDADEAAMTRTTFDFIQGTPTCFERSHLAGHVTGSAWVVDDDVSAAVMLYHAKLGLWLQPGGHADGDPDVANVALREAREETNLRDLRVDRTAIFDVDVHEIPEHKGEPAHFHYDIRFLIRGNRGEFPRPSSESRRVLWVPLDRVSDYSKRRSILRMMEKSQRLREAYASRSAVG